MRLHPAPSLPSTAALALSAWSLPHCNLKGNPPPPPTSLYHLHLHPLASSQPSHNLACAGCCCSIVPALYLHLHPLPSSHTHLHTLPFPTHTCTPKLFANPRLTLPAQAAAAQLLSVPSEVRRPTPAGRDRRARLAGHGLPRAGAPRHPRACAQAAGGPVRARQVGAGGFDRLYLWAFVRF